MAVVESVREMVEVGVMELVVASAEQEQAEEEGVEMEMARVRPSQRR